MIIREFLNWIDSAPDEPRAEAAGALGRAWLHSEMNEEERAGAAAALTLLLDDPSVDVRKAVAESLAESEHAPHHIVLTLTEDVDDIAELVLKSSPVLKEIELVDAAARASDRLQCAIAMRSNLTLGVAAALAEVGVCSACLTLLQNPSVTLLRSSLLRIAERHCDDVTMCEQLLQRNDLPLPLRHKLLKRLAEGLEDHPMVVQKVPEHMRNEFLADVDDKVTLRLALEAPDDDMSELIEHLRNEGLLSTRLLLRAVCCGRLRFFVSALSHLGKVPVPRLRQALISVRISALQAILRKAGLPIRSHQAFLLAIEIARSAEADFTKDLTLEEARAFTDSLLAELQDEALGADDDVKAFLRRFAVDVARLEARAYVRGKLQGALRVA